MFRLPFSGTSVLPLPEGVLLLAGYVSTIGFVLAST